MTNTSALSDSRGEDRGALKSCSCGLLPRIVIILALNVVEREYSRRTRHLRMHLVTTLLVVLSTD